MKKFNLVPVCIGWQTSPDPIRIIEYGYGIRVAGRECLGSIDEATLMRIRSLPRGISVLIINDYTENRTPMPFREKLFPLCSITSTGNSASFIETKKALSLGNYMLCYMRDSRGETLEEEPHPQRVSPSCGMEFKCHLDLRTAFRRRAKNAPYVNLDRDSESIGYSSWSGSLTHWFESGFTSRIQYGVQSGLFPEE